MMRHLLGNVECSAAVVVLPVTAKLLAQARIVRFLQTFGFLIETGQIPFDDHFDAIERIVFENGSARCLE